MLTAGCECMLWAAIVAAVWRGCDGGRGGERGGLAVCWKQ